MCKSKRTVFSLLLPAVVGVFSSVYFVTAIEITGASLNDIDAAWSKFESKYRKTFNNYEERDYRKNIFRRNLEFINAHNEEYNKGIHSYKLGVNEYADLEHHEFIEMFGLNRNLYDEMKFIRTKAFDRMKYASADVSENPLSINWTAKGAVTDVKNQGKCGSCWAFSTIGSLEGKLFIKTGKLISLSAQNLVDCSVTNFGCEGGWPYRALNYIKGGIESEADYPYEGQEGKCRYNRTKSVVKVRSYTKIVRGDEDALTNAIYMEGPISVCFDASHDSFRFYESGVYYEPKCKSNKPNHAVVAVGFGTERNNDYFIIKNSWGKGWGEDGYFKMARNRGNNCGIASFAIFPNI